MDRSAPVVLARDRALRRVNGMPDALTLRLEAYVPPDLQGRAVIVEQRLTRRDVATMLAAFDTSGRARALRPGHRGAPHPKTGMPPAQAKKP